MKVQTFISISWSKREREIGKTEVLCLTHWNSWMMGMFRWARRGDGLNLFVPSNSEWVTSPGPSNTGAKRSKVWVGHEEPDKNAHISTVNTAVLPSLSDTISPFRIPVYSDQAPIHHPSHHLYAGYQNHRKYIPSALETNISLTSHRIFANLNIKTMQ